MQKCSISTARRRSSLFPRSCSRVFRDIKMQHIKYLLGSNPSEIRTPAPVRAQMGLNLLN